MGSKKLAVGNKIVIKEFDLKTQKLIQKRMWPKRPSFHAEGTEGLIESVKRVPLLGLYYYIRINGTGRLEWLHESYVRDK